MEAGRQGRARARARSRAGKIPASRSHSQIERVLELLHQLHGFLFNLVSRNDACLKSLAGRSGSGRAADESVRVATSSATADVA